MKRKTWANRVVFHYVCSLPDDKYNDKKNYYSEMLIEYNKLLFDICRWGKTCAIKDEYKEFLKPYFD